MRHKLLPDVREAAERMMTFLWLLLIALAAVLIVLISSALVLSILLIINAIKDIWRQR
jgi:hypothetical protein